MEIIANNKLSIKEQLVSSIDTLATMSIVAETSIKSFKNLNIRQISQKLFDYFAKYDYKIDRKNFGVITIDKKRIVASLNYLLSDDEMAAYLAIPSILKHGIVIGMHDNHKGRKVQTVTIAAPVLIDEKHCFVATVIKRTNKDYYKVHRVLCADDFALKINVDDNKKENLAHVADANAPAITSETHVGTVPK